MIDARSATRDVPITENRSALPGSIREPIKEQLKALAQQLTQTQGQVERAGFANLIHQTDRTIGEIDHASDQLDLLAATPVDVQTKANFTQTIISYIGAHLLDAPSILNQNLTSNLPLSDNLIKAASRVVATRDKFFDRQSSDEVKSVYDYFAAYQAQLAVLLTEYYHTLPNTYSPSTVASNLARIERNVGAQVSSLKPAVPEGVVVDTRSGLMWTQQMDGNIRHLDSLAEIALGNILKRTHDHFQLLPSATSTSLTGLPFDNWSLPDTNEFDGLVAGWSGDSATNWLMKHARMSPSLVLSQNAHFFERNRFQWLGFVFHLDGPMDYLKYHFYDLRTGRESPQNEAAWRSGAGRSRWSAAFHGVIGAVIYERRPADGEQYWWH